MRLRVFFVVELHLVSTGVNIETLSCLVIMQTNIVVIERPIPHILSPVDHRTAHTHTPCFYMLVFLLQITNG